MPRIHPPQGEKVSARTYWSYGLGCIGRDANYTLFSMFLLTYLTLAIGLNNWQLGAVGIVLFVARIWDGINDPLMGIMIDNTHTRFGKFKPFILIGAVTNAICTIVLFSGILDPNKNWVLFMVMFIVSYLLWDISYTMNDIGYWSMLPSLTTNPKERERVSSLARIGANIGLFLVMALVPLFSSMGKLIDVYRYVSIGVAILFVLCQVLVVWGVQEDSSNITKTSAKDKVPIKEALKVIFKNDQLLVIVAVSTLFNIGYFVTTGFGVQFFYFDYGVYGGPEFTIFAVVLGVSQVIAMLLYPLFAKRFNRKQLFTGSLILVLIGYIGFILVGYVLPLNMITLCVIGFILFGGQAVIMLLQLVFLADTVEYGQWKLGKRNEGIVLSLNPLMMKVCSAVQSLVFAVTMILSGLNPYNKQISDLEKNPLLSKTEVKILGQQIVDGIPREMTFYMRLAMMILPLLLIIASYIVYMRKYKIDSVMYEKIITDLKERDEKSAEAAAADAN